MRRTIVFPLSVIALLFGLVACSASPSATNGATKEMGEDTVLLDVRSPEEYAAGHLEGAQLLDFNGGEVAQAIPTLDPNAEYFIYCRSGNRAGQAIALMEQAGFTNLTNLGSLEEAARATQLPIANK